MVDKEFHIKKIVHVWLTVAMYTVPITTFLYMNGMAGSAYVFHAFLPVEESPLWFAGYYIILVCMSPIINLFMNRASRNLVYSIVSISYICYSERQK